MSSEEVFKFTNIDESISKDWIHSESSKLRLKDAVVYYEKYSENNLITMESSNNHFIYHFLWSQAFWEQTFSQYSRIILQCKRKFKKLKIWMKCVK